ncbi:zinc ribbon domain-containing protein [Paludibacterium yongneupense]|uniref:zinc ribbon domain-containing protein n=1 Tax=Paludibacterium yongneupense TaxID=400061 RepID=UPI00048E5901|nr:zinc ribbon domain-containing protein [Paludibacterium yongneupense]
MLCPDCGSRVDPPRKVCPHCQADQAEDHLFALSFWTAGLPGALSGSILCVMLDWPPFAGCIAGVFAGIAIFAIGRRVLGHDGMDAPALVRQPPDGNWRE